jgi:CysZ protein
MIESIRAYFKSLSFMRQNGLMWLFCFPIIITALVLYGGIEITSMATDAITSYIKDWIESIEWFGDHSATIGTILYWIIWIILRIALYFFMAFVGGSVILLLMSPLLTYASELVAEKLGAVIPPFSIERFLNDLARAAWLAIKNGVIQFGLTLACILIGFIPFAGLVSPVLMFVIGAYFFGYNFIDYSLERKGLTASDSGSFVWKNKFKTIGIGAPFALWMLIPFIGPITSGFVALIATVASTISLESESSTPLRTDL